MKQLFENISTLSNFWNTLFFIIIVFFVAWIISRLIRYVIIQYLRKKSGREYKQTSIKFLKNSIKFIMGVIALSLIVISVPEFRSKAKYIFLGSGILVAIIGFAAQSALSNLVAGAFIVIFKPFRVDDYIRLDENRYGIVEDINLRHTVIRNFENKRIIIPNSIISIESILNHTIQELYVQSQTHFEVGLYANIDRVKEIISEEALKHPSIIDNRTPEEIVQDVNQIIIRVISVQNNIIKIRLYAWVSSPFDEFKFRCDVVESCHKRFIEEEIAMPTYFIKQE